MKVLDTMKRIVISIFALTLLVSLCGCNRSIHRESESPSVENNMRITDSCTSAGYDAVDDELVDEWGDAYDNHVSVDLEEFYIAYSLIDDYLSGESDSINLAEVYQLLEEGIGYFYDATEISSSDNWQVQDYKIDLQDSIEPIKSALAELEEYLMGDADSVNLIEVHDYLAQGLLNYQDIN